MLLLLSEILSSLISSVETFELKAQWQYYVCLLSNFLGFPSFRSQEKVFVKLEKSLGV